MRKIVIVVILLTAACFSKTKSAASDENLEVVPATLVALETEGLVEAANVDQPKTWIRELASQKLDGQRSRRVFLVQLFLKNGHELETITTVDKSPVPEESGTVVYVISKMLQPDGKPVPPKRQK